MISVQRTPQTSYDVPAEGATFTAREVVVTGLGTKPRNTLPPYANYAVASEGESFNAREVPAVTGAAISVGGSAIAPTYDVETEGEVWFPQFVAQVLPNAIAIVSQPDANGDVYIPFSGRVIDDHGVWLLTDGVRYGAGWFIDNVTQELVFQDDKPGSYPIQFLDDKGRSIVIEVPDDWTKE